MGNVLLSGNAILSEYPPKAQTEGKRFVMQMQYTCLDIQKQNAGHRITLTMAKKISYT